MAAPAQYGPNVSAWLREKEREGDAGRTPDEWLAYWNGLLATAEPGVRGRLKTLISGLKGLIDKDAALQPDDGELYTHTLRDETEEEAEAREREEEARAVAEVRRQRQRNALLGPEARAALEQQLAPIVTIPLFEGQTPATPFRIATYVDIELGRNAFIYQYGRLQKFARPLLERWFAEHPTDPLPHNVRIAIAERAERAASAIAARKLEESRAECAASDAQVDALLATLPEEDRPKQEDRIRDHQARTDRVFRTLEDAEHTLTRQSYMVLRMAKQGIYPQ